MIALLPAYLTKAYVRGHLRTLADGRAIQVHPYHTKTAAASREDAKTRDIFADIPPAENQHRPRIHPARTTTPRKAVVPFQAVYPQLFDDNPLASDQNGHYNKDIKGRNPAPATEEKKMDSKPNDAHHDPIHGYTDSVAQLEKDREQERRLRSELADAKRAEDEEWTPEVTEKRRAEWNDWLKAANGRKLSAKEIAEQEKKQGFTLDALKRHLARHGVDKRHVATKAALLKEMGKDLDAAKGTPIATDIKTVIDLIVSTDPENRPFQDTVKDKWSKGEKAAFERFKAWKAEKNATAAKEREAKATPEQAKPATSRLDAEKADWLSKLALYIDDAGENTVEGRELTLLRNVVEGVEIALLNKDGHPGEEFKSAVHSAIEASEHDTHLYNALHTMAFYRKHPPEPKEARLARAKAFHEAEQAAKAAAEKAKAGRIYLAVPYDQKDKAKATADKAGTRIRFDGDKKKWYWEGEGDLPGALARWK